MMQKLIPDRGTNDKWNIKKTHLDSLQLNTFHQTWSYAPSDSPSIDKRFEDADLDRESILRKDPFIKYNHRIVDDYHLLDIIPNDMVKKENRDWKVLYKYNRDWFRSDHFIKNHDGLHLLFTGCSNTEGVGANIEDTWSHMLYSAISKQHKTSGYFNLGRAGYGSQRIIQNFMTYVKECGAPDYLFVLMPNILRGFEWHVDLTKNIDGMWMYYQINPWSEPEKIEENVKKHREEFPVWLISWKLFIEYAKSLGTKVIWSTWDNWEDENIVNSDVFNDTFFIMPKVSEEDLYNRYRSLLSRKDSIHAREGHDGYIRQTAWYEAFLNNAKAKGYFNEVN